MFKTILNTRAMKRCVVSAVALVGLAMSADLNPVAAQNYGSNSFSFGFNTSSGNSNGWNSGGSYNRNYSNSQWVRNYQVNGTAMARSAVLTADITSVSEVARSGSGAMDGDQAVPTTTTT